MSQAIEVKRSRGRPASFPNTKTRMAGFNLPVDTLDRLSKATETRNAKKADGAPSVTQNTLVNRAILAYLRRD